MGRQSKPKGKKVPRQLNGRPLSDDIWYDPGPSYTVYDEKAGKFFGDEDNTDGYKITVKPFIDWKLRHGSDDSDGKSNKRDNRRGDWDYECLCSPPPPPHGQVDVHVTTSYPSEAPRYLYCPVHGDVPYTSSRYYPGHHHHHPGHYAYHPRDHYHHHRGYEYQHRAMDFYSPRVHFHSPIVSRYH